MMPMMGPPPHGMMPGPGPGKHVFILPFSLCLNKLQTNKDQVKCQ